MKQLPNLQRYQNSFESICKNGECADYEKVVLINMGFGIFKIGMPSDKIKCSKCNSKLSNIPLGCIFNKCKWKYEGIVMKNGDTEFVTTDFVVKG